MRTALLLRIGALLPLGLAGADSRVTDAVPGEGKVDNADGFEIVKPSTVFRPDTPQIVCVYKVEGAGLGTNTKSVWIAEDVGKAAPPNSTIFEKSLTPFLNSAPFPCRSRTTASRLAPIAWRFTLATNW